MKNRDHECATSKRLWSKEEDQLLKRIVGEQASPKWTYISQEFNESMRKSAASTRISRTNKQCRQRWQNHLNPSLKNFLPWSEDEHRKLFKLFKQFSHQWCQLAGKLQSEGFERRGQNNIKNYFYSAIKREIKRMNEVIRQNNKQTKRRKGEINQYRKKYSYNPRLSLQRQILGYSAPSTKCVFQSFSQHNHTQLPIISSENLLISPSAESNKYISLQESSQPFNKSNDLHIIKQLDYQLVSKILLIAEDKGSKKFVISSSQTKQCHQIAQQLRNQLIQLIIERQKPIQKDRVRSLAIKMLKISRKCKRKTLKSSDNFEQHNLIQEPHTLEKINMNPQTQICPTINPISTQKVVSTIFNQKAEIDKYIKVDQQINKFFNLDLIRNSQQYKNQQCYNSVPLSMLSSYDSGRLLMDSKNLMQRSSEFICNSNYSMLNYFEQHNPIPINSPYINFNEINLNKEQKPQKNKSLSQFINNIREVQPRIEQGQMAQELLPPQNILFPVIDFSILPSQKKSTISSQPLINNVHHSQQSAFKITNYIPSNDSIDGNFLTHSWAFSSGLLDQFSRRSSVQNNKDEWFSIPKHNYHTFGSQ